MFHGIKMKTYDVIIIGGGAAGLSAAAIVVGAGCRVAVIDMGHAPARKVMVSGGGKCNFTNMAVARDRYFGNNPDFVRGAIARITPNDILAWAAEHNIPYTEKTPGRYFTDSGAASVVAALLNDARGADIITNTRADAVSKNGNQFTVKTDQGDYCATAVIVATGGVSFPQLTVSDAGCNIAHSFGHKIVPMRPALGPIDVDAFPGEFAGISTPAEIRIGGTIIRDDLLFTHTGIGGPAAYRASVRNIDGGITINLMPGLNTAQILRDAKHTNGRRAVATVLSEYLPMRIARWFAPDTKNIADIRDSELDDIAQRITNIFITPDKMKLRGYPTAEVARGGIACDDISSKTMESKLCGGLFFAGEVLDIAGDLGGFNLHWAWASGRVAGDAAAQYIFKFEH